MSRWWLLLLFVLSGGLLYYSISDFLPKTIRNGIDSFGMRADLVLPYPSGETVHLHGSMVLFVFFFIGWRSLIRKATVPAPVVQAEPEVHAVPIARPAAVGRSVERSVE